MDRLNQWADFLWEVRGFFRQQGFLEVFTPTLVICPGTEPSIEPFSSQLQLGSRRQQLFLRTSPELKIKRLLTEDRPRIFEMGPVFRNEEITDFHEPEFMMLEWYRAHALLEQIQADVENLILHLAKKFSATKEVDFKKQTVREFLKEKLQVEIHSDWQLEEYRSTAQKKIANDLPSDQSAWTIDDYFFLLMQEAEKQMQPTTVYFLSEYPPFQAAYARMLPNGWAGRFEVYWQGMELANAFWEITDANTQEERFKADIAKKKQMGKTEVPLDEKFLQHLRDTVQKTKSGNSEANETEFVRLSLEPSGIALGLERLFMALTGIRKIQEIKPFPYSDLL